MTTFRQAHLATVLQIVSHLPPAHKRILTAVIHGEQLTVEEWRLVECDASLHDLLHRVSQGVISVLRSRRDDE